MIVCYCKRLQHIPKGHDWHSLACPAPFVDILRESVHTQYSNSLCYKLCLSIPVSWPWPIFKVTRVQIWSRKIVFFCFEFVSCALPDHLCYWLFLVIIVCMCMYSDNVFTAPRKKYKKTTNWEFDTRKKETKQPAHRVELYDQMKLKLFAVGWSVALRPQKP